MSYLCPLRTTRDDIIASQHDISAGERVVYSGTGINLPRLPAWMPVVILPHRNKRNLGTDPTRKSAFLVRASMMGNDDGAHVSNAASNSVLHISVGITHHEQRARHLDTNDNRILVGISSQMCIGRDDCCRFPAHALIDRSCTHLDRSKPGARKPGKNVG